MTKTPRILKTGKWLQIAQFLTQIFMDCLCKLFRHFIGPAAKEHLSALQVFCFYLS